ncbi:Uncharacterised protein [Mycobacteroides abscessus subsp. abscessus]|nr:Uncharacterised protein [Mycobacteroides abscessus subsp. abscessus]
MPTLSTTAIINTAVDGVDSTAESGNQLCSGQSGALTANANMNPRNKALSTPGPTPSSPLLAADAIARKSKVPLVKGLSSRVVTTYRPMTAASITRPPRRL